MNNKKQANYLDIIKGIDHLEFETIKRYHKSVKPINYSTDNPLAHFKCYI